MIHAKEAFELVENSKGLIKEQLEIIESKIKNAANSSETNVRHKVHKSIFNNIIEVLKQHGYSIARLSEVEMSISWKPLT